MHSCLLLPGRKQRRYEGFLMALFLPGLWQSVHIDDLRRSTIMVSNVTKLQDVAISQLFKPEGMPERESGGDLVGSWGGTRPGEDAGRQEWRPGLSKHAVVCPGDGPPCCHPLCIPAPAPQQELGTLVEPQGTIYCSPSHAGGGTSTRRIRSVDG